MAKHESHLRLSTPEVRRTVRDAFCGAWHGGLPEICSAALAIARIEPGRFDIQLPPVPAYDDAMRFLIEWTRCKWKPRPAAKRAIREIRRRHDRRHNGAKPTWDDLQDDALRFGIGVALAPRAAERDRKVRRKYLRDERTGHKIQTALLGPWLVLGLDMLGLALGAINAPEPDAEVKPGVSVRELGWAWFDKAGARLLCFADQLQKDFIYYAERGLAEQAIHDGARRSDFNDILGKSNDALEQRGAVVQSLDDEAGFADWAAELVSPASITQENDEHAVAEFAQLLHPAVPQRLYKLLRAKPELVDSTDVEWAQELGTKPQVLYNAFSKTRKGTPAEDQERLWELAQQLRPDA